MSTVTKHTPGPWDVVDRGTPNVEVRRSGEKRFRFPIAWLPKIEEFEANARLIAAAPDLLDALRELLAAHRCIGRAEVEACAECLSARAALAKSEGF